jgi:hypothetical protein
MKYFWLTLQLIIYCLILLANAIGVSIVLYHTSSIIGVGGALALGFWVLMGLFLFVLSFIVATFKNY